MTGIQFITDEAGRRTAAVIDLKKHKALWEDIEECWFPGRGGMRNAFRSPR
jgi:hypothetical protein